MLSAFHGWLLCHSAPEKIPPTLFFDAGIAVVQRPICCQLLHLCLSLSSHCAPKSLPVAQAFEASVDVQPLLKTLQGAQQARVHEYVNTHVHAPQTLFAEEVLRLARAAVRLLSQLSNAVRARIAQALREFLVRNRVRFFRFVLAWRLINMIPEIVVLVLLLEAAWICMLLLLATLIDEN
jgi:hypothetical protein